METPSFVVDKEKLKTTCAMDDCHHSCVWFLPTGLDGKRHRKYSKFCHKHHREAVRKKIPVE